MTKELSKTDALKQSVLAMKDQFRMTLPNHIPVERFIRTIQTAIMSNPKIATAERNSFFKACMNAASDGLLPDGKEAAIVPFNSKAGVMCTYMPMTAGILKKVRNSGELASITSQLVYSEDKFDYWIDSKGEHLEHRPNLFATSGRGEVVGAYALATTTSGAVYIEVMTIDQLEQVRNSSRAKDSGPWKDWASEMYRKTVIKRLAKRLPMSTDVELVIRREDEDLYGFDESETNNTPVNNDNPSRTERLVSEAFQEPEEPVDVTPNSQETDNIPI